MKGGDDAFLKYTASKNKPGHGSAVQWVAGGADPSLQGELVSGLRWCTAMHLAAAVQSSAQAPDHWRGRGCSESELHRSLGQTHAFPALSLPAHHSAQPKLFPHTDTHSVDKSSQAGWIKGVFFMHFHQCVREILWC